MNCLFKKMLRDLRVNWSQFVSVFLMAAISALIFSGMASVWTGLNKTVDTFISDTYMADIWVRASQIDDEDCNRIKEISNVEKMSRGMSLAFSVKDDESELQVNTVDNDDVSRPLVLSGNAYDVKSVDGIWIDRYYAEAHEIKQDDKIVIEGMLGEAEFNVEGLVMSPEYIYYTGNITETVPNYEKYGYSFVGNDGMLKLCPRINYTSAKIVADGAVDEALYEDILGEKFVCMQDREDFTAFARASQESQQMQKMAALFSFVFIMLSLMTMYTSMVRLVNRQQMVIGTMKALGKSAGAIRLHYACYGLAIPIVGGIVGLIAGRFTVSQVLLKVKQTTIYLPEWQLIHSEISFALIVLIAICCVAASILAANKCLKGMPVEIMRGTNLKKEKRFSQHLVKSKLGYQWRWTLRNIIGNKMRFLMGIVGVAGGMVLLIAGLGVKDAINESNDFVFSKQFNYGAKAIIADSDMDISNLGEIQLLRETNIELRAPDKSVKQTVLTVCDEGDMLRFYDDEDMRISLPDSGAYISRKLASDLNISKNDRIEIRVFGEQQWIEINIADTVKALTPQAVFMSRRAYETVGMEFEATSLLTRSNDAESLKQHENVKSAITSAQQKANTETVADSVMSIVRLLIIASVVLSVVILYNLGILNYVERIRDYATMKVLGFTQSEIRRIAVRDCIITTFIGWAIGLPLGICFLKLYIRIISFDTFEWLTVVKPATLIISSIIIVGVSLAVNLILSRKVKKIVMVEALKSVE